MEKTAGTGFKAAGRPSTPLGRRIRYAVLLPGVNEQGLFLHRYSPPSSYKQMVKRDLGELNVQRIRKLWGDVKPRSLSLHDCGCTFSFKATIILMNFLNQEVTQRVCELRKLSEVLWCPYGAQTGRRVVTGSSPHPGFYSSSCAICVPSRFRWKTTLRTSSSNSL